MPARLNPALERLRQGLAVTQARHFQHDERWGAPEAMSQALRAVCKAFDSAEVETDERSSTRALIRFKETGRFANFIELKYGCFGLGLPIKAGRGTWSVFGDEALLRRLLKLVDVEQKQPRRFRKCFQGLMHSYFSYPLFDEQVETTANNWKILQRYLGNHLDKALAVPKPPTWLATLHKHLNLLTARPCQPYAAELMNGSKKMLAQAAEGIGIGATSWVWQEAIKTAVREVCAVAMDDAYRGKVASMLDLLDDETEGRPSVSVIQDCLAMLLVRYVKCADRPEHPRLRDLAVQHIGNPWMHRAAWDAQVRNDSARKMVDGWLKRRLITDFFALLSEDGAADQRRLNYWLRFEPVIEDMWFALGSHARYADTSDFREMRKRMEGRLHYLSGQGSPFNNAFLMKIGPFLVVEFGVTGNATYIFNAGDSGINFAKREMSTSSLKGHSHVGRLIHMSSWEDTFDQWLCPRIGWHPETGIQPVVAKPTPPVRSSPSTAANRFAQARSAKPDDSQQVIDLLRELNLEYEDNRRKGGAFWIKTGDTNIILNDRLKRMGFRHTAGKGWWRE